MGFSRGGGGGYPHVLTVKLKIRILLNSHSSFKF
jgi:hypothetical protein